MWQNLIFLVGSAIGQLPDHPVVTALDRGLVGPAERVSADNDLEYPLNLARMGLRIPRVIDDDRVDQILHSPRTIYYKLPQTWQHWIPAHKVEHTNLTLGTKTYTTVRPIWNIYRTTFLSEFNANPDFPWEVTIGLNIPHRTGKSIYDTVNFISLPEDDDGKLVPILVLGDERPIKWIFPPGTMVGEVIYVNFEGRRWVQEVRTRTKSPESKTWFPGVFRPVRDRREFQYLTGIRYEPGKKYMTFRNPEEDEVFKIDGTVERLPPVDPETVKAILARPFQNVTKSGWHPSADIDFHILPKDYSLGLLNPDSESCASCHRQTQISVRNLIPREPNIINNPLKVGNIRGCDAVFSWHPFSMRSVLPDDRTPIEKFVYFRRFDHVNRIIQVLTGDQVTEREYKLTLYVQESLKGYELPAARYLHGKKMLDPVEDGLSLIDRRALFSDLRSLGPAPDGPPLFPVGAPVPPTPGATLRWEFRPDLDPKVHYQYRLMRGKVAIGVYDPWRDQFFAASGEMVTLRPLTPPVPIPAEFKRKTP